MKGTVNYRYIGNGASLAGIPTRDLTELEAKEYGVGLLLASGLYRKDTRRDVNEDVTAGVFEDFDETEVTNDSGY